jgi:hypothetical protein
MCVNDFDTERKTVWERFEKGELTETQRDDYLMALEISEELTTEQEKEYLKAAEEQLKEGMDDEDYGD